MKWYERLRWRLVGIQFMVVVIGIASVLLASRVLLGGMGPEVIRPNLTPYINSPETVATIEANILGAFQSTIFTSLVVAGLGAIVAGVLASLLLWRTLVIPMRKIALSSQRIVDGRYDERVPFPKQAGEALQQVVTNFNQMTAWLQTTEAQRVEMVGNVAHELRTPLAGLRGVIEGIEDGIYTPDSDIMQRAAGELDRLARLVDDLQNLSRIEAGTFALDLREFAIADIIKSVLTHLEPQAKVKDIALDWATPDEALAVFADPDRTAQVLTNLISNAIRYTAAGDSIHIKLCRYEQMVQIEVVDTGVGISAENLPHLFERFYRVDSSRSRHSGGSGVGLTIARHLTWAMQGELSAYSAGEGHGSTFTLRLPFASK